MHTSPRKTNPFICGCIDPSGFKPACITVIEGTSAPQKVTNGFMRILSTTV